MSNQEYEMNRDIVVMTIKDILFTELKDIKNNKAITFENYVSLHKQHSKILEYIQENSK